MQVIDLPAPDSKPESLGFSPDGRLLAAWTRNGRVFLLDTASGAARQLWRNDESYMYCIPAIGFTANGRYVVALHPGVDPGEILNWTVLLRLHNVNTGKVWRQFPNVHAMDVGANGLMAFTGDKNGEGHGAVLWDTRTNEKRFAFKRNIGFIQQLAVSADGHWVAESCVDLIRLWNLAGTKPPKRARRQFRSDRNKTIKAMAISATGEFIAATSLGLDVWDVQTARRTRLDTPTPGWGRELAFHPSKPILAYSGGTDTVTFWDAPTRDEVKRFDWKIGKVSAVAFSPDGLRCAAAGEGNVVVWDVDE